MIIGIYSPAPQSGKSTVGEILELYGFTRLSFADVVKKSLLVILVALNVKNPIEYLWGERKEEVIPELGVTGGYLMSTFATQFMRDTINPDVWLNIIKQKHQEGQLYYIDDLRFPNEFDWITDHGYTIKLIRKGAVNNRYGGSEGQLNKHDFNFILYNDRTLADLEKKVHQLITAILDVYYEG